ncbi:MAG: lipoyl(octanoyl) transferase LipB [Crocinitomicaceae bacterium]
MPAVTFKDLGLIDFKEAWDYQEFLFKENIDIKIRARNGESDLSTQNFLLFCEHPHVYTLGKSGKQGNLLLDEKGLEENQAAYYKINRGGDITYHGPGQLVVYPIFDLDSFFPDIHKYMRFLEQSVINTLEKYGIRGERVEGLTGVWIDGNSQSARKICAMGVKSSRWVTMHGIGFNINTDLSYFSHIIPCGIDDKAVTSLERELGEKVSLEDIKTILKEELAKQFEYKYTE